MQSPLFREEVLESHKKNAYGTVVLTYPITNWVLVACALGLITLLISFAVFTKYTRHEKISGVLEPSEGVVKLYAPQIGKLKSSSIRQGAIVHKGDVLLTFASEHETKNGLPIEAELDKQLNGQLVDLRQELVSTLALQQADAATSRSTLASLLSNRENLNAELSKMRKRVDYTKTALNSYEKLAQSGYMSLLQVQAKNDELIDQEIRLHEVTQSIATLEADIKRVQHDLENLPLRASVAKAQLGRTISNAQSEISKQQKAHNWTIVAPCDGVISVLNIAENQTADLGTPLIIIIPKNSRLRAKIYAPSHSIGFLRQGQSVNLKFDAFPFQKFGFIKGRLLSVAESPILSSEISLGTRLAVSGGLESTAINSSSSSEPMYTIIIDLENQFVNAYGTRQRLLPGMQVEADIQLDTRTVYEWLLEPLYSMSQR